MKQFGFFALAVFVIACSDDKDNGPHIQWTKLGLDGKTVNEIQFTGSTLYVATTTGLFKMDVNAQGNFEVVGFADENVEAIEVFSVDEMIVSIFNRQSGEPPALFRTDDAGETWDEIDSNYGGSFPEPVFDLERHPENENILYAAGYAVLAKSLNGGLEWEPIYGAWGGIATGVSVVELNPFAGNEIWAGGQGPIENGLLLRSSNESDWHVWGDLVANPTTVKEIAFSEKDAGEIMVGFEGALIKTDDGGEHWKTLIESEDNRFYFGICRRNQDTKRVYTGGWLKTTDPQPLILFVSDDGGDTWREYRYISETYGGILEMQIRKNAGYDELYIGLDKGGVYRVDIRF